MIDSEQDRNEIETLCRGLGVTRLDLFGSTATGGRTPESDIDLLVQFDRSRGDLFARYFDLKEALERIFGRPVDLVVEEAIRNPYFKQAVERSRRNVFAA